MKTLKSMSVMSDMIESKKLDKLEFLMTLEVIL